MDVEPLKLKSVAPHHTKVPSNQFSFKSLKTNKNLINHYGIQSAQCESKKFIQVSLFCNNYISYMNNCSIK